MKPRLTLVLYGLGIVLVAASLSSVVVQRNGGTVAPAADVSPLAKLEKKAVDQPADAKTWADLGAAYVDHARVNSDPSAYAKAERALARSLEIDSDGNWEALASQGALAAGRHDFANALRHSNQARGLQPHSSFILGVVVDSLTELGRYPEAVQAAQDMVDLRPDLASYARVSYQRELHGDIPGAIEAMQSASQAAASGGDKAFAIFHLGELEWSRGAVDAAEAHYDDALRADPTAMQAIAGLGRVAAARGDRAKAIALYEEAVAGFPDPDALKELGELYLATGNQRLAEERFRQSAAENAEQAAGGVYVDLELALFSADHRRNLADGLAAARREWGRRNSIHVADALAWQLFANGQYEEALGYANKALELGTRSASFHFHRAEINRALGRVAEARADYEAALSMNPNFSVLHAGKATDALTELAS